MKRILIATILLLLLFGCKGSMNNIGTPFFVETEFATFDKGSAFLIDRKIASVVLDVSQKDLAQLNIRIADEIQINNKRHFIYWTIKIRFNENSYFKIHR